MHTCSHSKSVIQYIENSQVHDLQFGSRNDNYRLGNGVCSRVGFTHTELRKQREKLFILTDCKSAINCIAPRAGNCVISRNSVSNQIRSIDLAI